MQRGRGAVTVVAGLLTAVSVNVPAAGPANAAPAAVAPAQSAVRGGTAASEASAAVAARRAGSRVEVTSRRSETQQVFANPDGTFTAEVYAVPVRVHRSDGSWAPVDTTLRARSDGSLAPVSTAAPVSFSGGGAAPLARLSRGGHDLAVTWPGRLPKPVVAGDTATYRSVLPGVDLRVRAEYAGFAQELVVASPAAAANPALRRIRLGLDAPGLTVRKNADRSLSAVDTSGAVVFRSPPALMWDAAPESGAAVRRAGFATAPAPARGRQARVEVTATGSGVEVVPDVDMLTGSATRFPLVIDPSWTAMDPAWTLVNSYDANSATWRTADGTLAIGYRNSTSPNALARTYLRFGLKSDIFDARVLSAEVRMFEVWSPSCTATGMKMYGTGGFDSTTTWNHQPTWGRYLDTTTAAYGYSASCGPNWISLDATSWIASAAAVHATYPTFGLRASDETDPLGWKQFTATGTDAPRLTIVYNHPPNTPAPSDMSTSNPTTSCATTQATAQRVNITSSGITMRVVPTDADSGDYLETTIQFWQYGGVAPIQTYVSPKVLSYPPNPTPVTATMLNGVALRPGLYYAWRAVVKDYKGAGVYMDSSATSANCWLLYDPAAP